MLETLLNPSDKDEQCGLVMKDGTIIHITNIAEDKEAGFEMNPEELVKYADDPDVEGTWHTHPDGDSTLSGADLFGFLAWPKWKHYVIGLRDGKPHVSSFEIKEGAAVICE